MSEIGKRWLIDLGNSRSKCAPLDGDGRRGDVLAIEHASDPGHARLLQHMGAAVSAGEVWLASVAAPARSEAVDEALRGAGWEVHRVMTGAACGRLRIAYAEPASFGVDRFLSLLAASSRADGPWLVVSAGSALTVDLLASDGIHHGGLIAPMPVDMRAALAHRFVQLDLPEGQVSDFASDTAGAIASGAHAAILGLVEHSLRRGYRRLSLEPTLLLTGGGAPALRGIRAAKSFELPWLVIDGLAAYVRNGGH